MYSTDKLIILDADGTTIDAFEAIKKTFKAHDLDIGDLERFQKRRHLFKYLGGLKEIPKNFTQRLNKKKRRRMIQTLTDVYRNEVKLYDHIDLLIKALIDQPGLRVGLITRNITNEPKLTLRKLFARHDIDMDELDFQLHVPLGQEKVDAFREVRDQYRINPARAYACGDEKIDFLAARATGMHPFMVSYGFEDLKRLTVNVGVPGETISQTPAELCQRVVNALDLQPGDEVQQ